MKETQLSRRAFLRSASGAAKSSIIVLSLPAILVSCERSKLASLNNEEFSLLSEEEAQEFHAIAARIIPTDETPGASEAGVIYFIDTVLADDREAEYETLRLGLRELQISAALRFDVPYFHELEAAQQDELLTEIEDTPFFGTIRFLTIAGMFSLPEYGGNRDNIGYELIGFEDRHAWQPPFGSYDADFAERRIAMAEANSQPSYPYREEVDFVIVGSGAAGGVMAKELSVAGFSVVVLEQGPHLKAADFKHDEWGYDVNKDLTQGARQGYPQTYRKSVDHEAETRESVLDYAHNVGGSSVHFSGNFWRFRPIDFIEASVRGPIAGTNFADWPITYDELEPYYTKVDWEVGVSGLAGSWDPPRSREYPCPPMPIKSSDVLLERAAKEMGLTPYPAPVAILSQPHNGRPGCIHCGFCNGYGCEVNAKSSSMAAMIPLALESGNCELRTGCTVSRVNTDENGRANQVVYWGEDGREYAQRAKAVVLCANGAETPRLLLASESAQHPDGLANSSGVVGTNLMYNGYSTVVGLFDEPVNAYKSVPATRVIHDFYELDPSLGFYGGGGIDGRHFSAGRPMNMALAGGLISGGPTWGSEYKRNLQKEFTHTAAFDGHTTSLPLSTNTVTLDPDVTDKFGRAAMRTTYTDHPDDIATMKFFYDKSMELMDVAGATNSVGFYADTGQEGSVHLLGTCRMGNDPTTSVVDKFNRSHDVENLFMVDGSSLVTSGRGQPTMTIMALAFRAADNIIQFARRGEI